MGNMLPKLYGSVIQEKIADLLARIELPSVQKIITY